ncbi:eukaryotic translation initiation factor 3 subunit G-B-like [Anoplophora glabripennis]|uniref:eukaryotic translation initiation factor 3 subunit G-B-like n=1 Tax=Anoplophora glabripennis TaxID=217634 RepID=UPI000C75E279|nr:eukaryotic translation initiation factor 3 subunit G-B-like [Anoplophora glabripennis]
MSDKNFVKCPYCNKKVPDATSATSDSDFGKVVRCHYIPPSLRHEATKGPDGSSKARRCDNYSVIRIDNLHVSTTEIDLEDLVKPFGLIQKLYLAKNKQTGLCKGFADVHFKFRNDAAKAISMLNGYGYDHLILNVDWSMSLSCSKK